MKKIIIILLVLVFWASVAGNIYLFYRLYDASQIVKKAQINAKVLAFRDMFTKNVLLNSHEIDYDTRWEMEAAVRAINDEQIFNQWQKFVKAGTQEEASLEAKKLLSLLIDKTSAK